MKKFIYSLLIGSVLFLGSCSKDLETVPSDQTVPSVIFADANSAYLALNGIYRAFYNSGSLWSSNYAAENFGPSAVNITSDLMAEDMPQRDMGSQWFLYDYLYMMRTSIAGTSDHPYAYWKMYYKFIDNANNIIANIDDTPGDDADKNNIKGQALAIRAYSYLQLIQWYARTYFGHESDAGVMIYTTPSDKTTEGKKRSTVQEVYNQITSDLNTAINLLDPANCVPQKHKSHIDYYVACGLMSRVALNMQDWENASKYAKEAMDSPNIMITGKINDGFNSVAGEEWMWGSEIVESQSTQSNDFFTHMDSRMYYASDSRKCINSWLYFQIGKQDSRLNWFVSPENWINNDEYKHPEDYSYGDEVAFNQMKFRLANTASGQMAYIYMRAAEMALNYAEAECMLGNYENARLALKSLIETRDPNYAVRLATVPDGNVYTYPDMGVYIETPDPTDPDQNYVDMALTLYKPASLIDEIYLQRRIELWGEGFRINDVRRQKQGFYRDFPGSNHNSPGDCEYLGLYYVDWSFDPTDPETWEFTYMLPQAEFDGNPNIGPADQND